MGESRSTADEPGLFRRAINRLSVTDDQVEARDLQHQCSRLGATPIGETKDRELAEVAGTVRSVTLRPVGGVPAMEADLYDGSGAVRLVFLGRRNVAGVEPGRTMAAKGRISRDGTRAVIYNPAYTLVRPGSKK